MRAMWMMLAVMLVGPALAWGAEGEKRLNVLLILSDDLCADLGCYGAPVVTPNVDAIAKVGVRLDRVYCQYPLCGPSRCSFMSGLRPDTTGVLANGLPVRHKLKDVVTLPQLFRQNGYYVARAGKVYHLGIPNEVGTPGPDDPASWDYAYNPKSGEYPTKDDGDEFIPEPKVVQGFRRNLLKDDEGKSQADYQVASEVIRLMGEHKDGPFFLACGFIRPHVPEVAPKKYFDLYDISAIKLPEVPAGDREGKPGVAFQHGKPDLGMSRADCAESKRAYYATTSFMDHQVGRVMAELDRLGLRESTLVIFMSDHGYLLGQHREWQKSMLFEEACRVPMIFSWPGMGNRGAVARGLAESVDLYPTVCEIAGLVGPKELEGKSLTPLLAHPEGAFKEAAYSTVVRKTAVGRSVRTERWRYTEWDGGEKGAELYDHEADPKELVNLAGEGKWKDQVAELKGMLKKQFPRRPAGAGGKGGEN